MSDEKKELKMIQDWIEIVQVAGSDMPLADKVEIIKKAGMAKTFKKDLNDLPEAAGG